MSFEECLEKQLSEMNLLLGMFSCDEIHLTEPQMLTDIERFLEKKREAVPKRLSFDLNISLNDIKAVITFSCVFPQKYPTENPEVYAKSDRFDRTQQKLINDDLKQFMNDITLEDTGVLSLIMWIQENAQNYITNSVKQCNDHGKDSTSTVKKKKYTGISRLWIYSHHIYRKELLKKIPDFAKDLDLTGFVLPGKPGIICVEGYKENCDVYWQKLKYPNWKHISCKHREDEVLLTEDTVEGGQLKKFRLFEKFEELAFEAHGDYGLRNDYHMDLGKFREYLDNHNCKYMFSLFFGLDDVKH